MQDTPPKAKGRKLPLIKSKRSTSVSPRRLIPLSSPKRKPFVRTTRPTSQELHTGRFLARHNTCSFEFDEIVENNVGSQARQEYFTNLKNLNNLVQQYKFVKTPYSPQIAYLKSTEKQGVYPRPIGVLRRKGSQQEIDVRNKGIGDTYATALSKSIRSNTLVRHLDLSSNNLTEKGVSQVVTNISDDIKTLDLSENVVGYASIQIIKTRLGSIYTKLNRLNLENTKLSDFHVEGLCQALSANKTVKSLNLANNNLGEISGRAIGDMLIYNKSIQSLDISWNRFFIGDCKDIWDGLEENFTLHELDISYNSLGRNPNIVEQISQSLSENSSLRHIDLSNNSINESAWLTIGEGLQTNHSILGIHMVGNTCLVDAKGFIVKSNNRVDIQKTHIQKRMLNSPRNLLAGRNFSNCWICENWVQMTFYYQEDGLDNSDVYIHLGIDDYYQEKMSCTSPGLYEVQRVVPQREIMFFFSTANGKTHTSKKYQTRPISPSITRQIDYSWENTKSIECFHVNHAIPEGITCTNNAPGTFIPRFNQPVPPPLKPQPPPPEPWSIAKSLFKKIVSDTDFVNAKCFEVDWGSTKLNRLIKNANELERVKTVVKYEYKWLKETYNKLAGQSTFAGYFGISLNTFTEFAMKCGILDSDSLKLSDLDVNWTATNSTAQNTNPRIPKNAICRFKFIELNVRLALDKYLRNGRAESASEAVSMFIDELKPHCKENDADRWRKERFLFEEVDLIFKRYYSIFNHIYEINSGLKTPPGQANFMWLDEWQNICLNSGLLNNALPARDIDLIFKLSMSTQVDELHSDRMIQMTLTEFIEAIARLSDQANVTPLQILYGAIFQFKDNLVNLDTSTPLSTRIENAVPYFFMICSPIFRDSYKFPRSSPYAEIKSNKVKGQLLKLPSSRKIEKSPSKSRIESSPSKTNL